MADFPSNPPPPVPHESRGLIEELMRLAASVGRHLQALADLAGYEAREAGILYLRLLVFVVVALVCSIFGYTLLLLFIAFLIAHLFHVSWIWITLGLGVLHFVATAVCAWLVKNSLATPVFVATSAEFKKDLAVLSQPK